jgi:hypothetical protein
MRNRGKHNTYDKYSGIGEEADSISISFPRQYYFILITNPLLNESIHFLQDFPPVLLYGAI